MPVSLGILNLENYYPGLRDNSLNILYGKPGSGKTIIGLQFLIDGALKGEEVLYVSLDESAYEVKKDFENMQWNLDIINVIDAVPSSKKKEIAPYREVTQVTDVIRMRDVKVKGTGREIDIFNLRSTIKNIMEKNKFTRVVIDSLTSLKLFYTTGVDPEEAALAFVDFFRYIENSTVLFIAEDFDDLNTIMRMMDSVLRLDKDENDYTLEIVKSSYILKKTNISLVLKNNGFAVE
ncbi:MAG: RAD55 family ATPase [Thermoplasmata archaeon]